VSYSDKDKSERFFRVDRILDVKKSRKVIKLPREEQFSAGSEEKLIHYMHSGTRSETFTVNYRGLFETVKDQFPSARETKIVKANESPFETVREIKFEAYERGTLMWLLSQGDRVELVKPTEARRRLKEQVERMLAQYHS
jgi:predicted DNA-binding transcriptional regulator YafY